MYIHRLHAVLIILMEMGEMKFIYEDDKIDNIGFQSSRDLVPKASRFRLDRNDQYLLAWL